MKQFGSRVYSLPASLVHKILIIDDVVTEHGKMEMENAEARSRVR